MARRCWPSWDFGASRIGGFLRTISGNKVLEAADVEPVLDSLRSQLMSKNVAAEVAEELARSVGASLEGQRLASFTT